jgi:hypothetical protein
MKLVLAILSVIFFDYASAVGQTSEHTTVSNIPGMHYQSSATDYNETGHLTYSSDSALSTFAFATPYEYFDGLYRSGDTLYFSYSGSYGDRVRMVLASTSGSFRSIDVFGYVPYYGGVCDDQSSSLIHLEDVSMVDSVNYFTLTLTGDQLLGHALFCTMETCDGTGGGAYWQDKYVSNGTVNPNSVVSITILKQDIISATVSARRPPQIFNLNPQPADSYLTVTLPDGFRQENFQVADILGRVALDIVVPIGLRATRINVSSLPSGSYFLTTASGSQMFLVRH